MEVCDYSPNYSPDPRPISLDTYRKFNDRSYVDFNFRRVDGGADLHGH